MKQIELTSAVALEQLVQQARDEDIVLTCQGHPVALLSEIDEEELYWYAREHDPDFAASLARARDQVQQGQVTSHMDLKRKLGIETP